MNFLRGSVEGVDGTGARLAVGGQSIALARKIGATNGEAVTFGVRPEHISIAEGSGVRLTDVKVDLVEQLGGSTLLYATTLDGQPLAIALEGQRVVETGSTVTAYADPRRCHLFGANGQAL